MIIPLSQNLLKWTQIDVLLQQMRTEPEIFSNCILCAPSSKVFTLPRPLFLNSTDFNQNCTSMYLEEGKNLVFMEVDQEVIWTIC